MHTFVCIYIPTQSFQEPAPTNTREIKTHQTKKKHLKSQIKPPLRINILQSIYQPSMAESWKKKTNRTAIKHKAWSLVRMALLWARKGGVFKRWPLLELRNLLSKHLKALAHHNNSDRYLSRYGERELSFDETPLFNAKKKKIRRPTSMRFLLPCIASPIEFDYEFGMDGQDYSDEVISYGYDEPSVEKCDRTDKDDEEEEEEKGVDVRAEEFIAKFYEQIKLQRQISYMKYRE